MIIFFSQIRHHLLLCILFFINIIFCGDFRGAINRRLNAFPVSDRSKDSAEHHDPGELPDMTEENDWICNSQITNLDANAFAEILKALLIVISYMSRRLYSIWLSSFRFRFAHVLRMQENVQVADGAEPARARGMRQDLIHLSVLSQHHADEVQSIESPEEGARLLRFNCRRDIQVVRFAIVPEIDNRSFFVLGRTVLFSSPTMMSL